MLHQNIETFIGCESSYADADIVLYGARSIPPQVTAPAHGSAPPPCVTKATASRHTARIRIKI